MSNKSRGTKRENDLVKMLRADGWLAFRAPASLGVADVLALKAGLLPRLIEVKTDVRSPFAHFGPEKRLALKAAAEIGGAVPQLCWWPARRQPRFLHADAWPRDGSADVANSAADAA